MENISTLSGAGNLSFDNPFGSSAGQYSLAHEEHFQGNDLKAFLDKEEKMCQSAASLKSDNEEKSSMPSTPSGITIRSFMVDSGDSHLLHNKLTMSQYIAYKSEPLGHLGDSVESQERPYFSFKHEEANTIGKSSEEIGDSAVMEFNPDFREEPSWLKKQTLSSLSSSDCLELSSCGPENSENWLIVKEPPLKTQEPSSPPQPPVTVDVQPLPEVVVEAEEACILQNHTSGEIPSMYWKPTSDGKSFQQEQQFESTKLDPAASCHSKMDHSYVAGHVDLFSFSHQLSGRRLSDIASAGSSQSSTSVASTVRENRDRTSQSSALSSVDLPRYDSIISEPQLSSTREISDEFIESGLSCTPLYTHDQLEKQPTQEPSGAVTNVGLQKTMRDSIISAFASSLATNSRLQSTGRTSGATISEPTTERVSRSLRGASSGEDLEVTRQEIKRLVQSVVEECGDDDNDETIRDLKSVVEHLDKEWAEQSGSGPRSERSKGRTGANGTALSVDSLLAVFSNASSLSTPLLMSRIKQHVLGLRTSQTSAVRSDSRSSGIGGSGFDSQFSVSEDRLSVDCLSEGNFGSVGGSASSSSALTDSSLGVRDIRTPVPTLPSDQVQSVVPSVPVPKLSAPVLPAVVLGTSSSAAPVATTSTQIVPAMANTATVAHATGIESAKPIIGTVAKQMLHRHTLSTLPSHSTPGRVVCGVKAKMNAVAGPPTVVDTHFTRVTSTIIKKIPPAEYRLSTGPVPAAKGKMNLGEPRTASNGVQSTAPVVKVNKSHVYFGGADFKSRQTQRQRIVVRNSSFKQSLELDFRIKDGQDFKIIDSKTDHGELVSRCVLEFGPRQERSVELAFQPRGLGYFSTKLNMYPRCGDMAYKNVKYTVDLSGYGGASQVHLLIAGNTNRVTNSAPGKILVPKSNGNHWTCRFALENRGNVHAFAYIQPSYEDGSSVDASRFIVLPQCSILKVGDVKEIQMLIHPKVKGQLEPLAFKLNLFWGDEALRNRWIKCVMNGIVLKQLSQTLTVDWSKLLQVESNSPCKTPVADEDVDLFYGNVRLDEVAVIFHESRDDSNFVTLASETATVLESTTTHANNDTLPSQRPLNGTSNTTNCGQSPQGGCISAGITELVFASTQVGTTSTQKIPLQNWSSTNQEIRVKEISGPFSMRHTRSAVPGGFYTRLPVHFQPSTSGPHIGKVTLDVGSAHSPQPLITIVLKGDAF